jgi:predicted naringenin-chalcone synthase
MTVSTVTPSIVAIGTAVPPTRLAQHEVRDLFAAQPGLDRRGQRLVHAAFDAAAIDHRHTVLRGLLDPGDAEPDDLAVRGADGELLSPSTGARSLEYQRLAPALFRSAAAQALSDADVVPGEVTHLITVSCTGLFAPGPDVLLVRDLGLDPTVERYHLGFVGCAAAMPALRAAHRFVVAQPDAVVLVVCAELCSLHIRTSSDPQQIVAASVFADGAAAAVVRAAEPRSRRLELDDFATALVPEGEREMAWTVGDEGFQMVLSAEVPRIVGREVRAAAERLLDVDAWAVHPGGRSILDRVSSGLDLDDDAMIPSRRVLREYGNMSSATILFILRELLHDPALPDGASIGALAFGPGLTVESARLRRRSGDGS